MELLSARRFVQRGKASRWTLGSDDGSYPWSRFRFLIFDGNPAVNIGNGCETCEFFFRLLREDIDSEVLDSARESTEEGISDLSSGVVDEFGSLVPRGRYEVALFEAPPRKPTDPGVQDYFESEQAEAWGEDHEPLSIVDSGMGFDNDALSSRDYYRVGVDSLNISDRLFEFLIPLQPIAAIDSGRLSHYRTLARDGKKPTAVALGVLEVRESWGIPQVHWVFANYLIDGHHKVEAAALEGTPLTVLSFIALDHSWPQVPDLIRLYQNRINRT